MKMFTLGLRGLDVEVEAEMHLSDLDFKSELEYTLIFEGHEVDWKLDEKEHDKIADKYLQLCFDDLMEAGL